MKRKLSLSLIPLLFTGCALLHQTDRTFLSNALAEYTYLEAHYEAVCVNVKGPDTCKAFQADISAAKAELQLAEKVLPLGAMPKEEKTAIDYRMKKIRSYP